jgi:hypothetical protein
MEGNFAQGGAITQSRPVADPGLQSALSLLSFARMPFPAFGQITDVTAVANCYRVQCEKGIGTITATVCNLGAVTNFGATSLGSLSAGTRVLMIIHPGAYYGLIIGAIPDAELNPKRSMCEQLSHTSRNRVDDAHLHPLKLPGGGHVTNWMNGRPFDATSVGEAGWITETGLRIFIDPFMAMLGCDEATGVFAFYHDQLLRIAGYNLRMFTAGMEREGMDDQGEYNDWEGFTPYPWEQLGLFTRGDPRKENEPQVWQIDEPHHGPWEPKDDRQRPWHRERRFHGYIGQGGKHNVCTHPTDKPEQALYGSDQPVYPGLFDMSVLMDGRLLVSSAKGISLCKRVAIVSPARAYVPEQIKDEGDSDSSYKAAGIVGDGADHKISSDLTASGSPAELIRALGVQDLHAYMFNYAVFHGFYGHEKDWTTPEQSEMDHVDGQFMQVPAFSKLASSMFLSAPTPKEIEIDHRYQKAKYYQNVSGLDFLEDGGVLLYDGFGAELRMTAGGMTIAAPGDVMIKPGRSVVILGGDDVVIRAKNSMDLTVSEKDLRLKAEKNLHVLAGNSGEGGLLLEGRGASTYDFDEVTGEDVKSGGVMLRAENSEVVAWAQRVYLRTGGGDITGGPIVLDADKGQNQIITHALSQQHYVDSAVYIHFGSEGEVRATDLIHESAALFSGLIFADGAGIFNGSCLIDGTFISVGGHIATTVGCSFPFVGCLDDPSKPRAAIAELSEQVSESLPENPGSEQYQSILEDLFYDEDKPGNDDVIKGAEFSLRNQEQYGTQDFKLFEDRWQQQARIMGAIPAKWEEKPVECLAEPETYPYPGKENFQNDTFYTQGLDFVELQQGREKDRGTQPSLQAPYVNPKFKQPEATSLDEYPVIR